MKTVADFIIQTLVELQIDKIFGVPGGAIEPLFNSIAKDSDLELITARSESSAGFMAYGYSKSTEKLGVVCSTTGPAATNLITPISNAYIDNIPVLVITPQTSIHKFGRNSLQDSSSELDTVSIFKEITAYSTLISHVDQVESKLFEALATSSISKKPVHLSIPSNILKERIEGESHYPRIFQNMLRYSQWILNKLLSESKSPIIYIGGKSNSELMNLCNSVNLPYICSPTGKGAVDETSTLFRGVFGFGGHESAGTALRDSDLIIIVGSNLNEIETNNWSEDLLNQKTVHISSNILDFKEGKNTGTNILSDELSLLFDVKFPKLEVPSRIEYFNFETEFLEDSVSPKNLMVLSSVYLPFNCKVFVDSGNSWAWSIHYFLRPENTGKYNISMEFGAMTWAIGAAIGSYFSDNSPTVVFVGDGSYLMCSQELTVAVENKLPIVFIILNDSSLGMVKFGQRLGNQEEIGHNLPLVDYCLLAQSLGANSLKLNRDQDILNVPWDTLFTLDRPTLIEVMVNKDEVPPMGERISGLAVTPGS